jgi:hypothetical protein
MSKIKEWFTQYPEWLTTHDTARRK